MQKGFTLNSFMYMLVYYIFEFITLKKKKGLPFILQFSIALCMQAHKYIHLLLLVVTIEQVWK